MTGAGTFFWILIFLGLFFIWMGWVEPRAYRMSHHRVRLRKPLATSLKVLHLSDIHFAGPNRSLARFFDQLGGETYDFVFVTGDILDCEAGIPSCVENLKKIKSKHGVFAVFGNHDYYDYHLWDIVAHSFPGQNRPARIQPTPLFEKALKEAGARVLKNETVAANAGGTPVLIHGLDDPTTGRANLRQAMRNFDRTKINMLLTHTIDVFLDIGENEIDLSFSGHSHGGQIRLPVVGPIVTHTTIGRTYAGGIRMLQGAVCSISRGMGASRFFSFRLLCPPEAIVLEVNGSSQGS